MVRLTRRTFHLLIIFCCVLVFAFALIYQFAQAPAEITQSSQHIVVAAVGDFGGGVDAAKVFQGVHDALPDFAIGLGDLSYGDISPEDDWCAFVKKNIQGVPLELIAGNHEEGSGYDGHIDNFTKCLPDKIGAVGEYGKEYYVDYPQKNPLARFILISPDIALPGGRRDYTSSTSPHTKWLVDAIRNARADKIKWVIVGMHKVCITVGLKQCEIGHGVMDLLAKERVDLILQGHDHVYERSKQFICTDLPFKGNCVIYSLDSHTYTKGQGPMLIIAGTGGRPLNKTPATTPDAQYFVTYMDQNAKPSKGFLKLDISADALEGTFVPVVGQGFTDSFTIK